MVLYILLSGEPPFYHDDTFELYELIKNCKYNFDSAVWKQVSADAKDLIKNLLTKEPEERLSAEGVLNHPWITKQLDKDSTQLKKISGWDTQRKLEKLRGSSKRNQSEEKANNEQNGEDSY